MVLFFSLITVLVPACTTATLLCPIHIFLNKWLSQKEYTFEEIVLGANTNKIMPLCPTVTAAEKYNSHVHFVSIELPCSNNNGLVLTS